MQNQSATRPVSNLASAQQSPETFIPLGSDPLARRPGNFIEEGQEGQGRRATLSTSENTPCPSVSGMATRFRSCIFQNISKNLDMLIS